MNNTICSNITTAALLPKFNSTALQNLNCTNGSGTDNSTLTWNTFDLYSSTAKIIACSTVYGIVSIIALAGNFMVFLVVAMNRTMHTATNILLLNLSLSDILFVLLGVPGFLTQEICNGRWPLSGTTGETMAKLMQQTGVFAAASSAFTLMAIAFERFLAVVHPLKQMARKKKSTTALTLAIIWICAIAISTPSSIYIVIVSTLVPVRRDGEVVLEEVTFVNLALSEDQVKVYVMVLFISIIVIPIIFLSIFYARIVYKLWHPDKRLSSEAATHSEHQKRKNFVEKKRRKTTIMLLTVVMVFFLCMIPYNILNLLLAFGNAEKFNPDIFLHASSILRVLIIVNSASNPIIYNFLSERFRKGFQSMLKSLTKRRQNRIN